MAGESWSIGSLRPVKDPDAEYNFRLIADAIDRRSGVVQEAGDYIYIYIGEYEGSNYWRFQISTNTLRLYINDTFKWEVSP